MRMLYSSLVVGLTTLFILVGCGPKNDSNSSNTTSSADPNTLVLAAGSEVKDMGPLLDQLRAETGVSLKLEFIGTLDGIQRIAEGAQYDGAWFSHAKYMMLVPDAAARVKASEKIMFSPVVLGVKTSKAKSFGWGPNTSWAEIAEKSGRGEFKFGMTNPTSSNSGFSALVGVAASFAQKSDALEEADIDAKRMAKLFKGQTLTAGSSGWLADRYVEEQNGLDGLINYESVLLSLNRGGLVKEALTLIYPDDGVLTADYPLILMNDSKRAAYDKAVAWLKGPKAQQWIMTNSLRRPVVPAVALDKAIFGNTLVVDMAFPGKLSVVNSLLYSYLGEQRRPASMYFVLDQSGSMSGDRLVDLNRALHVLAGSESQSLTGQFSRLQPRERVTLIPFDSTVRTNQVLHLEVGTTANENSAHSKLKTFADRMDANGGTAMYAGLVEAYTQIAKDIQLEPDRYYSVVVMTDGQSNEGMDNTEFEKWFKLQPESVRNVKAFPVLFGGGDKNQLHAVATLTGGKMFDASKSSLAAMFKEIRGYQ